ncbi:MAG: replication initiation protein [Deltaproteobacteria bacterium]|nr:MAG: replication initiation protein [Deltaproteobacteria bacterium]
MELQERRLFAFCLQHYDSRENASNPLYFDVPIAKFKESYPEYKNYKPNKIYKLCEETINGIQSKGYRPNPNSQKTVWWFQELEVIGDDLDGIIRFGLTPASMPYFLGLKSHYISYHMADIKLMNKPSAWNLYEYLKEKFQNGQIWKWDISVDKLKERLGVADKYINRFNNFEKKCLITPLADINSQTDIHADYHKIKKGVKVVKICFTVANKCSDPDVIDTEDQTKVFKRELEKVGISKAMIKRIVTATVEQSRVDEMLQKIPAAKKSYAKHGTGSWAPYLAGTMSNTLEIQKNLSLNAPSKKSVLAQQIDCWESMSNYGCKASGRMGKNELCKNCEHNKT